MTTKETLIERCTSLISEGKNIPKGYEMDELLSARKEKWTTSAVFLLEKTFGLGNVYVNSFVHSQTFGNHYARITHGVAILEGAKEEIEKGFLNGIRHLVEVDFFDSIIEQAEHLLETGYKDAAAILGRVIIETTLKDVAGREHIVFDQNIKLSSLNDLLWKSEIYDKIVWRLMQGHIDIGNSAAHGKFDEYNAKQVKDMLSWICEKVLTL
jgi:hypothetical protein